MTSTGLIGKPVCHDGYLHVCKYASMSELIFVLISYLPICDMFVCLNARQTVGVVWLFSRVFSVDVLCVWACGQWLFMA